MNYRVAILTQNDPLWLFSAWSRTIPLLAKNKNINLIGLWLCDEKFVNLKPEKVYFWYIKTLGVKNFALLGLFMLIFKIKTYCGFLLNHFPKSYLDVCKSHGVKFNYIKNPNDRKFAEWVKKNHVDILIITIGHIVREPLLSAPNIAIINKHAALLPANKGVFPYIWAKINNQRQGISFHKVVKKIDAGELTFQEKVPEEYTNSMVRFYYYVYKHFGDMLQSALVNTVNVNKIKQIHNYAPSYYGLPTRDDYEVFKKGGGVIIRIRDLPLALQL